MQVLADPYRGLRSSGRKAWNIKRQDATPSTLTGRLTLGISGGAKRRPLHAVVMPILPLDLTSGQLQPLLEFLALGISFECNSSHVTDPVENGYKVVLGECSPDSSLQYPRQLPR